MAPQATALPLEQTMPAVPVLAPDATQLAPTQHPPPPHTLPGQQACPGPPQTGHAPAAQVAPLEQVDPALMQLLFPESQQAPAEQDWPAQHG